MLTFAVMLLGVLAGRFFPAAHKSKNEKLQLACTLALIFAMGISLGGGGRFFASLAFIGGQSLLFCLVPTAGIIAGSLLGGLLCAFLVNWPVNEALSVAGGLGWYSLSGAAVSRLAGPEIGSIAFLASLLRELFSFFLIPFLARGLNGWTAIAPAAATSEDTTLPMLIRYTNEETAVFAVVNGILCSAAVPVILPLCY